MSGDKPSEDLETTMQKLESIVSELEKGESSLEQALEKFEEGLRLGKKCRQLLDRAELRVKKLVENAAGELEEEDLGGDV